nr:hypothetical protein [Lysobacter enzymogenes]
MRRPPWTPPASSRPARASPRAASDCAGQGRSYDRKDLQRTGETDVGQALRKLDPRLR